MYENEFTGTLHHSVFSVFCLCPLVRSEISLSSSQTRIHTAYKDRLSSW